MVESFDITKKEWKTVTEAHFEIEEMHFAKGAFRKTYMAKCTTYPFKSKQRVIKNLNQSTIIHLNVFKISSESLTRKPVQMNTLAQYMAKSFRLTAEKANISFHFGEIFHCNNVYYGKIGSIESVTIKELIPGKFVKYINNDGSRCMKPILRLRLATLLKERLWHRCFPVNFAKLLRTLFLTEHLRWLLL